MNDERILLVDDDPGLRELLSRYLGREGYSVKAVAEGVAGKRALDQGHYDLIVLDLMLPGEDGLSLLKRWRAEGVPTPVIMLTAKGDEVDRIVGLELGADDYLPKPCNPRELLARIRAVLRRAQATPVPAVPGVPEQTLRFGRCELDPVARTLARDGQVHRLTSGEFALLSALVRHPRVPLTRDRLISLARGRDSDPFERSVDVAISKLRRLIEDDPKAPRHIQTVWGHGYVFVPD
ncbi:MAG: two-component system response regulator OmpR [Xanthomonadales bacterium PRO6]|nr:Transcriptional regulatory protein OmpR [Xanthomonadales bacterium]MCE7932201.1 two-component system response regulator OmpR [Xanthomonadales bacterium PRO6]